MDHTEKVQLIQKSDVDLVVDSGLKGLTDLYGTNTKQTTFDAADNQRCRLSLKITGIICKRVELVSQNC